MDRLAGLTAFVRTADLGNFVAASRVLGLSPSAVGKAVTRLEQDLGVRLFQRSTRSIRLTEEGRLFHDRCRRILDDLEDAEAMLMGTLEQPRGRLRISAPIATYHLFVPVLSDFARAYPEIELDLDFNDRLRDLIEEGVDIAIRSGDLPDSRLMARALRPYQMLLCAAPEYLERHGVPMRPRDLAGHLAIRFRMPNSGKLQAWPIRPGPDASEPQIGVAMACNNMEALKGAVVAGLGIGCMPDFLVRDALAAGTLRTVLRDHVEGPGQFHLLWPSNRHLSPKIRAGVDFLGARLFARTCDIPETTP